jgi:hypothetical protein
LAVLTRQRHYDVRQDLWDKFWKDKDGNYVVWQRPNAFLIAWAVLSILTIFTTGLLSNIFWWAAEAVLVGWSVLEIWKGVNYFRKTLGVLVLLLVIMMALKVL